MVNHFLLHTSNPLTKLSSLCLVCYLVLSRFIVLFLSVCVMKLDVEDIPTGVAFKKMFAVIGISIIDLGHGLNFLMSRSYEQAECDSSL